MKRTLIIIQLLMGMTALFNPTPLEAQTVSGLRPNSYYRSFAAEISAASKQQQQHQQGLVTITGMPKADYSSLSNYNIYPVRRLQLVGSMDSVHGIPGLEVGEAVLLIIQPIPYQRSLFVFDVQRHSINVLADLRIYEEAFRYGNASSLSFVYFLESEKYLGNVPMVADSSGHSVSFLKNGSGTLTPLPELLLERYGSIAGLRQRVEKEQDESDIKKEAFKSFDPAKDAADFIRKSWQVRSRCLPHDTAANIQLLLNDISTALNIDGHTLQPVLPFLEAHLRLSAPDAPLSVDDLNQMVLFMGKDIRRDLAHVLNAEQLKQYLRHLAIWNWQYKAVDIYVYTVYLKGTYASIEEKNKAYYDYMLTFYKN